MVTKKKKLQPPYLAIEEVDDYSVVYNSVGEYSVIYRVQNPIEKYSSDPDAYYAYNSFVEGLIKTLGAGYCVQKHDIFAKETYRSAESGDFLQNSYFRYFDGRSYTAHSAYIILTQEKKKKGRYQYDYKSWKSFLSNVVKVKDLLEGANFSPHLLSKEEASLYLHRFFCLNFKDDVVSLSNLYATEEYLRFDDRVTKCVSLVDVDEIDTPNTIAPLHQRSINGATFSEDLFSFLDDISAADVIVYNQSIYIPNQLAETKRLVKKHNNHASLPSAANNVAKEDIEAVQKIVETDNKMFVYMNYTLLVSSKTPNAAFNQLESEFGKRGFRLSRSNYNQLELFLSALPGCAYRSNAEYDRLLTLNDVAGCLQYKEEAETDEVTPLKVYYTNRIGIPRCIDITGKEGAKKMTTNSNFFCLGPSGSGKSFHMNSVVRQLYEQNTDIVMVDTGHSYEGLCNYLGGRYITYSEEHPISMNPFRITKEELNVEKVNFLKSLLSVIWKGANGSVTTVEEEVLSRTINAYYRFFFSPFNGYTPEERADRTRMLMLDVGTSRKQDLYSRARERNIQKKLKSIEALANDGDAGEKDNALMKLEELRNKYGTDVEDDEIKEIVAYEIDSEEDTLRGIRVTELTFNSFFEFAMQYIPFLIETNKVEFDIQNFKFLLAKFYRGGELEKTLNEEMDTSLFDESFIVFEIDAIKDDPTLFPIVTLIIMDVFLQKMRFKHNRKALIIEEAWKAIASPMMAGYILYLYKTVRKFWGIVGVVTQEIEDIISSDIVKSAIINNSEITILLDQTKLKDRFDDIKALLGLTDTECAKIWTINNLDNREGRGAFKEVYIRRGNVGAVYGVEESPECYMAYTTEKVEKDALAQYREKYGDMQTALTHFCEDWRASKSSSIMDFAKKVLSDE